MNIDNLSDFGADLRLISALKGGGFNEFRNIQANSVRRGLFFNVSQFICSPSGSGKTLIGEMAAIHNILQNEDGKSLYLVPLRALAGEKSTYFTEMYGYLGIKVVMAVGDMEVKNSDLQSSSLLIMTYEKFDSYLRDIKENSWISYINTIIVDEIHTIGEFKRGPRLESLLLRLFMHLKNIQFIALSATVANPQELGEWFIKLSRIFGHNDFEILFSDKRPVQLDYSIIQSDNKLKTIIYLSKKIIAEGGQLLIFTNSRRDAEEIAGYLSENISQILNENSIMTIQSKVKNLDSLSIPLDLNLSTDIINLIKNGIGFHHAGLDSNERFFIEKLFLSGILKIIVCTTTLSAGINTPARMVILKETEIFEKVMDNLNDLYLNKSVKNSNLNENAATVKFERKKLERNVFHQILGRAGRPGYDDQGFARILTDSGTSAIAIQDYYFTKENHPEKAFRPVYNSVLSKLYNKGKLSEFILLCIYELNGMSISNIEKLLEYTYFFKIAENLKIYRSMLLSVYYGELFQLLKLFSTPDNIIDAQSKNFKTSIYFLTTKKIEGIVKEPENHIYFKVKFDYHRGIYCDCTKKYSKLEHDKQYNIKGDFNFCIHEIALINYLVDLINAETFELVVNNTDEVVNEKVDINYEIERKTRKKGEKHPHFKRVKEIEMYRNAEGNANNSNEIKFRSEFKSAADILEERKENGENFESDKISTKNYHKINSKIKNLYNGYNSDDWENSNIPIMISQDQDDANLLKFINLENTFEFSDAIRSGKISKFIVKYIIERIVNRAIFGENIIEFLINNDLIDVNPVSSDNFDLKKKITDNNKSDKMNKNISRSKEDNSSHNLRLKDETGYVLLNNGTGKECNRFYNTTFICTELGKIIIKCYVFPQTALLFRDLLSEHLNTMKSFSQLHNISSVEIEKLNEIFFQIIEKLLLSEQRKIFSYSTDILKMRVNGLTFEKIHAYLKRKISDDKSISKIYLPDVKNFIEDSIRVLNFMCEFVKKMGEREEYKISSGKKINTAFRSIIPNLDLKAQKFLSVRLEVLNSRIKLGVPETLLNLASIFKNFTHEQLQKLYSKGFKKKSDFTIISPEGFANIVQISLKNAKIILKNIKEEKN